MTRGAGSAGRRAELAAFLRSRRERISPEAVGLLPGARRRTPGLRREEVALCAGFGRHLGEPVWTGFVRALSAASPEFARMWAAHDVARPGSRMKIFHHSGGGQVRTVSTSMALPSPPETRMVVYTPVDDESRERIAWVRAHPEAPATAHTHPVTVPG